MALDMKDMNILGSVINTTYGNSSQSQKNSVYNVQAKMHGEKMVITCITIINLIDI